MTVPAPEKLPPRSRRILLLVTLTLLLDLISFSIIFPLFPAMLEYYRGHDGGAGMFSGLTALLDALADVAGSPAHAAGVTVLFGGLLGSGYSLLQFLCAPFFGAMSDRYGRRPVLLVCLSGILISYAMWFFASSFAFFIVSRMLGGIMAANVTTTTAIVSDITTPRTRSKGMALIGIAFGIGFTVGPAFGGISSLFDATAIFPALVPYGITPWSIAAGISFLLTLLNLLQVALFLPETRPDGVGAQHAHHTLSPRALFKTEEYPGVTRTNFSYFIFLLAFSGIEFTLTFFAAERFGYTPAQNARLFLVVGLVLVLMQGGYVQRFAARVGLRRMALHGIYVTVPGLVCIGLSGQVQSAGLLFLGVALIAAGTAQTTPCLTSLASLYTPADEQGRVMGVFRSLGALARATGPILACAVYWRLGSAAAYFLGAAMMLAPVLLVRTLPPTPEKEETPAKAGA